MAIEQQKSWYIENISFRDQVIVDVGANKGELSQLFWDMSSGTSDIVSIEPLQENVKLLHKRIALQQGDNWRVEQCVVSAEDGEAFVGFSYDSFDGWNSTICSSEGLPIPTDLDFRRLVPARRLSSLCPNATVVKLDVEGHEYVVLHEALERLKEVHTWAIEFHLLPHRPLELALSALSSQGFKLVAAGAQGGHATGAWGSISISPSLSWDDIPLQETREDGTVFKMIHVLATR